MSNRLKLLILVKLVIFILLLDVSDCLAIYGVIESDTTWSNTVYITGDIVVPYGVALTIAPGTVVFVWDQCLWDTTNGNEDMCDIIVYGVLNASGTPSDSITFTAFDPYVGSQGWGFIKFDISERGLSSDTCTIEYANISYCYGIQFLSSFGLLYNNTFRINSNIYRKKYIYVMNTDYVEIENNSIYEDYIYGFVLEYVIYVENSSFISIHNNNIVSRVTRILTHDCTDVIVSKNTLSCVPNASKLRNNVFSHSSNRSRGDLATKSICARGSRIRVYDNIILDSRGRTFFSEGFSTSGIGIACKGSCIEIDNNTIIDCVGGIGALDGMGYPFCGSPGIGISCSGCDSCIIISNNVISCCVGGNHCEYMPGGDGIGINCNNSSPQLIGNLISDCAGGSNSPWGGIGILIG